MKGEREQRVGSRRRREAGEAGTLGEGRQGTTAATGVQTGSIPRRLTYFADGV